MPQFPLVIRHTGFLLALLATFAVPGALTDILR
jgi:hypothetical protein